jgi:hypothetical protein
MNKNIIIGILLVVVAVGAYYMYTGKSVPALNINTEQDTMMGESASNDDSKHTVAWTFTPAGEDATTNAQKTQVTVTWDGTAHDAGTYLGSCAEIDGTNGSLDENQVSGALCWFAGAGDEIGVFNEGGKYVIKYGEQQEPSAEAQGFRGNFKTIITL